MLQLIPEVPSGLRQTVKVVEHSIYIFILENSRLSKNSVRGIVVSVSEMVVSNNSS